MLLGAPVAAVEAPHGGRPSSAPNLPAPADPRQRAAAAFLARRDGRRQALVALPSFRVEPGRAVVEVLVAGAPPTTLSHRPLRWELRLFGARIARAADRLPLETSAFGTALGRVQLVPAGPDVLLVVQLARELPARLGHSAVADGITRLSLELEGAARTGGAVSRGQASGGGSEPAGERRSGEPATGELPAPPPSQPALAPLPASAPIEPGPDTIAVQRSTPTARRAWGRIALQAQLATTSGLGLRLELAPIIGGRSFLSLALGGASSGLTAGAEAEATIAIVPLWRAARVSPTLSLAYSFGVVTPLADRWLRGALGSAVAGELQATIAGTPLHLLTPTVGLSYRSDGHFLILVSVGKSFQLDSLQTGVGAGRRLALSGLELLAVRLALGYQF